MIDLILYMKQGIPQSGIHLQAIRDPHLILGKQRELMPLLSRNNHTKAHIRDLLTNRSPKTVAGYSPDENYDTGNPCPFVSGGFIEGL